MNSIKSSRSRFLSRRRSGIPIFFLIAFALLFFSAAASHPEQLDASAVAKPDEDSSEEVTRAVYKGIEETEDVMGYLIFDVQAGPVRFSDDGLWAAARLEFRDRETLQPIPTEPGLALAVLEGGNWQAFLPSTPGWDLALTQVPPDLLSDEARQGWLAQYGDALAALDLGPFTGYLLPWAGGEQNYLTRSITHGVGGSMHYAFDFARPGYPSSMFAVYASKGGSVRYAVWDYPNGYDDGNCNHQNYIVLEHTNTTPTTYTMYIHLAQDSIPLPLRSIGAPVVQGQFIGVADDTGCSSGNHLHIQAHTNPYSYWGSSVDMVFSDVAINGGRPRTPDEAEQYPEYGSFGQHLYTSGNTVQTDVSPPTGEILSPATGEMIQESTLHVSGLASDTGSGLDQYRLMAASSGGWLDASGAMSAPGFGLDIDLCGLGISDGPVSLALDLRDQAGNSAFPEGLTHLIKDFDCPPQPPACIPGPSQVALYEGVGYVGACGLYGPGEYLSADLGAVGLDSVSSVLVGSNARATIFSQDNFQGRSDSLAGDDPNLGDNSVPAGTLDSMTVSGGAALPATPSPIWPAASAQWLESDSVDLFWLNPGNGDDFEARILGPLSLTSPWLERPIWSLGSLYPGAYTWQVRARNSQGTSGWSPPRALQVLPDTPPPGPLISVPYTQGFENGLDGWETGGLWHITSTPAMVRSGTESAWYADPGSGAYDTGDPNSGALTSPPINIPSPGYSLRFWYRFETEPAGSPYDQRWVQVSAGGAPFEGLYRLDHDEANAWLQSPAISLDSFAGQTVRIRFHFTTLDGERNAYAGWAIDDLTVAQETSPSCPGANEPNNSPEAATQLSYGADLDGEICPAGDLDYFRFSGFEGERIYLDIDAEVDGSALDSYLFLLAADGSSLLASNDDEVLFERHDSQIGFVLPYSGEYLILLRAWDHPGAGSQGHSYRLRLGQDGLDPGLTLSGPETGSFLPDQEITLSASATDNGTEISRVEFLWHDYDWAQAAWSALAEDWDGSDGWSASFDAGVYPEGSGLAFFAQAYDLAGNTAGEGIWSLSVDRTPPVSVIEPIAPTHASTAAWVAWSATDNVAGIASFDLQARIDDGIWTDYQDPYAGYTQGTWFIGEPGQLVDFRLRATDLAGNIEDYPSAAEATTLLLPCSEPDAFEPDDTPAGSHPVAPDQPPERHNFCEVGDSDWVRLDGQAGLHYRIFTQPTSPDSAVSVEVYRSDTTTLLANASSGSFGGFLLTGFTAPATESYYVRLSHTQPQVAGDGVGYLLWVEPGYEVVLPAAHGSPVP